MGYNISMTGLERVAEKEERDAVAWVWARKIVDGICNKRIGSPQELLVGTVHCAGFLQDVAVFLWDTSTIPCDCKEVFEQEEVDRRNTYKNSLMRRCEEDPEVYTEEYMKICLGRWEEDTREFWDESYHICASYRAKVLLDSLKEE